MEIDVEFQERKEKMEIPEGKTCMDLVLELGLSPDITIVLFEGRPTPIDERLEPGNYRLVSVASGG